MSEKLREAARQALKALKHSGAANMRYGMEAITTLEAALSEDSSRPAQPVQEPVAKCTNSDSWNCKYCRKTESCDALKDTRNFAAPPQPVQEPVALDCGEYGCAEGCCGTASCLPSAKRKSKAQPVQEPAQEPDVPEATFGNLKPVGWFEPPHGAFRANPQCRIRFPSQLLSWQIPLYTHPPKAEPKPVQEPVAWMDIAEDGTRLSVRQWSDGNNEEVPLYAAPPQRPPLTNEEINDCLPLDAVRLPPGLKEFARRIERKVRGEKE